MLGLEPIEAVDYSNLFPSASNEALSLLQSMLAFSRSGREVASRSEEAHFGEEGVTESVFRGDSQ